MITLQEYYDSIISEAKHSADIDGTSVEFNFLRQALEELVVYGEIDSFEMNEDGNDSSGLWRIDAYYVDTASEVSTGAISLIVSDFSTGLELVDFKKSDLDKLVKLSKRFIEFALEKNIYSFFEAGSCAFDAAEAIKERWKKDANNFRLYVITNKVLSSKVIELPHFEVHGVSVGVALWDINRFFQLELSGRDREPLEIDLSDRPLKALVASTDEPKDIISMLAVMPATTLVEIYAKWGSRLLEQNVRSFLTSKVKVNKGIRETIKSSPKKFFAFNNGITATAESVETEERSGGEYITKISNFQIVNGGQTTASLYSAHTKDKFDLSDIFVQMKLSIIHAKDAVKLVPYISKFANSQNKVTDADFFSNHAFHIRFESFSRNIVAPQRRGAISGVKWFYERARGQYTNALASCTSKAERERFISLNPRSQLITKTALAKYLNSFELFPYWVAKGAEFNFSKFAALIAERWDESEDSFNDTFFKISVAKAIIFKTVERLISEQRGNWFKGGHRDKLVPYSISYIANAIRRIDHEFDFFDIWNNQETGEELDKLIDVVAERVNGLLNDPNRTVSNVGEYAKREIFWERVCEDSNQFEIENYAHIFIEKLKAYEQELDSRVGQKILRGRELIAEVLSTEPRKWEAIRDFYTENNLMSQDRLALIKQAIYKRPPLSERQCKALHDLIVEYESHFRG